MNFRLLDPLNSVRVILASGSPRRSEILSKLGISFTVQVSDFQENLSKDLPPKDYVLQTARGKMEAVYSKNSESDSLIIAADTIVVLDSKILEKPNSTSDALHMLSALNGKTHSVLTALIIYYTKNGVLRKEEIVEETIVEFGNNCAELLDSYVQTLEPMDKAGGYGYQGMGAFLVKRIEGDYYNVVGFPAFAFLDLMIKLL
jgi:septum formation protein